MKRLIYQGMLIGILLTIVADSILWFISGSSEATSARRFIVIGQIVVISAVAWWLWRRARRDAALLEVMLPGKLTND